MRANEAVEGIGRYRAMFRRSSGGSLSNSSLGARSTSLWRNEKKVIAVS